MCSTPSTVLYMGLDLSTQQLKAAIVDDELTVHHTASVHFDSDFPEFRTHGGVVQNKTTNAHVVTTPTLLWVKALDMLMDRLRSCGVDFTRIVSISGTAQQHGSVYWYKGSESVLEKLDSSEFLHHQLSGCFAISNSPVWMDSSTTTQCRVLEECVGGPRNLAEITGSRAYERFTGSQIMKIAKTFPEVYQNTERISLVSSFLCSLFLGKIAPIDHADASGMNLMNIRTKQWDQKLLDACGANLGEKLGKPVISFIDVGRISPYYVDRWDFDENCKIVAFTGDNPASLAGMRLSKGWLAVSLGTSDTIFLWLQEPKVVTEGHVLCNPVDPDAYMAMLCYKNGSLTREKIRDRCCEGSWDIFNQLLNSTPRGNFGNLGLYYTNREINPFLQGEFRYNKANDKIVKFTSLEVEIRALIEGQFIARKAHVEDLGFKFDENTKILATGGASANKTILQVISDVFNAPVYTQEIADSAMLGAAYQAKHALYRPANFFDVTKCLPEPKLICEPFTDALEIYEPMVERYRLIVNNLTNKN